MIDKNDGTDPIIWHRSHYKLYRGSWGIAIIAEAGYTAFHSSDYRKSAICLTEGLCFCDLSPPYPESQNLRPDEVKWFCLGLRFVSGQIASRSPYPADTLLRSIAFSYCDIQAEGFAAAAMQWAGEAFGFPTVDIQVEFDPDSGVNGTYIFHFDGRSFL